MKINTLQLIILFFAATSGYSNASALSEGVYTPKVPSIAICDQEVRNIQYLSGRLAGFTLVVCGAEPELVQMVCNEQTVCTGVHDLTDYVSTISSIQGDKYLWTRVYLNHYSISADFNKLE